MKSKMGLIALALIATGLIACNHEVLHPVVEDHAQAPIKGEAVDLSVEWLKNKDDSVDARLWLMNRTSKPIFTTVNSYKLNYNGTDFTPRADEGLVQVPPGQKMKVTLIFAMPEQKNRAGKATLIVNPVFQGSPDADTKTKLSEMKVELNLTGQATR